MNNNNSVKELRFAGIDTWNRPVFKDNDGCFYGSIDIIFSYGAQEKEVLASVDEKDLLFFGGSFDCEPIGTPAGNIHIIREE